MKSIKKRKTDKDYERNTKLAKNEKRANKGITLIALVVTIVVLLILARSKHCNINRRQPDC